MILCIDVGNTQIVVGVYDMGEKDSVGTMSAETGLIQHFRIATRNEATADELAISFSQMFSLGGLGGLGSISDVMVSSSNSEVGVTVVEAIKRWMGVVPIVLKGDLDVGIAIAYDSPSEVGPDRIADAVAMHHLYGGPAIVVDFGTATTFDALNADGEYLGGAIAPGVAISLDALFSSASALRSVELVEPRSPIGRSTEESIRSGVLYGYASMVDGMCERFQAELGPCKIVGTGGLCPLVAPYSKMILVHEPWLTLHGLRLIYERISGI